MMKKKKHQNNVKKTTILHHHAKPGDNVKWPKLVPRLCPNWCLGCQNCRFQTLMTWHADGRCRKSHQAVNGMYIQISAQPICKRASFIVSQSTQREKAVARASGKSVSLCWRDKRLYGIRYISTPTLTHACASIHLHVDSIQSWFQRSNPHQLALMGREHQT